MSLGNLWGGTGQGKVHFSRETQCNKERAVYLYASLRRIVRCKQVQDLLSLFTEAGEMRLDESRGGGDPFTQGSGGRWYWVDSMERGDDLGLFTNLTSSNKGEGNFGG